MMPQTCHNKRPHPPALNQDSLGIQGLRFSNENDIEIWIKPLTNGEWALAFVNMSEQPKILKFDWLRHKMGDDLNQRFLDFKKETYSIRDLYGHKIIGNTTTELNAEIKSHDVLFIKLEK